MHRFLGPPRDRRRDRDALLDNQLAENALQQRALALALPATDDEHIAGAELQVDTAEAEARLLFQQRLPHCLGRRRAVRDRARSPAHRATGERCHWAVTQRLLAGHRRWRARAAIPRRVRVRGHADVEVHTLIGRAPDEIPLRPDGELPEGPHEGVDQGDDWQRDRGLQCPAIDHHVVAQGGQGHKHGQAVVKRCRHLLHPEPAACKAELLFPRRRDAVHEGRSPSQHLQRPDLAEGLGATVQSQVLGGQLLVSQ
mmetsp:Transcript_36433/g.104853  ORF Transcript_36433/g.104853 Transcript_36433/m.104853 type:complete len:255 (+) Transcript_36433:221-985(+)